MADDREEKSELLKLLEKNAHTPGGLSLDEFNRVLYLIDAAPPNPGKPCSHCPHEDRRDAIYDTNFCRAHARFALYMKKTRVT